jgi:hypothetical protein
MPAGLSQNLCKPQTTEQNRGKPNEAAAALSDAALIIVADLVVEISLGFPARRLPVLPGFWL